MKSISYKGLWYLVGLLAFAVIVLYAMGKPDGASVLLAIFCCVLALAMSKHEKLSTYSYTVMILAAVTVALSSPQYFIQWGGFPVKKLIIPLLQIITFGVGSTMDLDEFRNIVKMPKGVFIGTTCHFTIMPFVGFTIAKLFHFPNEIAAGVILVGCSPSGLASNVMAFISKANLALSVSITAASTLLAPIMTPLLMQWLGGALVPVHFLDLLWDVAQILILPIVTGLVFRTVFRSKTEFLNKFMPKVSMAGIAFIIMVITAAGRGSLMIVGPALIIAMFLHMTIGFSLGYSVARLFGMPEQDCRAVALEVGMQNSGLASGIAAAMGKISTVGLAAAVNGPMMNTVFSLISTWWGSYEL